MSVKYDTESKTWTAQYSGRHPIRRTPKSLKRINIATKAEAKRIEAELIFKIKKSFEAPPPGTILYRDLLSRYFSSLSERDLNPKTIENYQVNLNAHTKHWFNRPIDSISAEDIRNLIRVKLAERMPGHQKNILKFIRGVFKYAVEARLILNNPVPHMHFRSGDKIKGVLSQQQAKILLEKAKEYRHEWYPIWVTALYTGMRNGELHALTWDKIDFENATLLVSSSWNSKDGLKDLTKSGDDRIIGIAPILLTLLKELKLSSDSSIFVLPRIADWDTGRQAEILRMFLAGINLPRITFHNLRASWATMLLSHGKEPAKVMKLGGWKTLKTMMIYLRKAGIDTRGTLDDFQIHDPSVKNADVLLLKPAILS